MKKPTVLFVYLLINFSSYLSTGQITNVCSNVTIEASICNGQSYILPDGAATGLAGIYENIFTSVEGCDSVITTILTIDLPDRIKEEATICSTETHTLPDGAVVNEEKVYFSTIINEDGCEQVVETTLNVNVSDWVNTWLFICKGETYELPDGRLVGEEGTYQTTLTSIYGCDSVINIILGVNTPTAKENIQICEGSTYVLPDSIEVSEAGFYETIITQPSGCMELTETTIIVNEVFQITRNESICEGNTFLLPDGMEVSTPGVYETLLNSSFNCDSVVITNLTASPTIFTQESISLCNNANYTLPNDSVVSTAGVYTAVLVDEQACERITETTIIINDAFQVAQNISICEGSTFLLPDGMEVSTTGIYETLLNSSFNCDSIVTTNLTVSPSSFIKESINLCENTNYTLPNDSVVSTAGVYTTVFIDEQGCERTTETIIILDIILGTTREESICEGGTFVLPDGMEVSATGVYETVLSSSQNCDSVVITNLIVSSTVFTQESINLCESANYTLPNDSVVSTPGVYTAVFIDEQGCDRTTETTIIIDDAFQASQNISICEGSTFLLPDGAEVSTPGVYETILSSSQNCDSILLTVLDVQTLKIDMEQEIEGQPDGVTLQNISTSSNPLSYSWLPVNDLSCFDCPNPVATPNETTTYQLTVQDILSGCMASAEITVLWVSENPFVPTAFSPNQDGVNDYFAAQNLDNTSSFQFAIYNRWGEKIFQTNNPQESWDGYFNNQKQPIGVYAWVLNYIQENGTTALLSGNVTLIR